MKRITESEKQRIIELHRNTPMKPFLFEDTQVPFKNNQEGDKFRKWVNYHYPKLAGFLELDPIGKYSDSYYNSWIIKAWNYPLRIGSIEKKMGDWYKEDISKTGGYSWSTGGGELPKDIPTTSIVSKPTPTQYGDYISNPESNVTWETMDPEARHNFLMLASLGSLLIPVVGLFVSAGIDLYDAYLYRKEQDNKSASISTLFAILSVIPYVNKIPRIAKFGDDIILSISKTFNKGGFRSLNGKQFEAMKEIAKALKTEEGIKALNQGIINYGNRLGLIDKAAKFNKIKDVTNKIAIFSGVGYGLAGAPGNPIYTIMGKSVDELISGWGEMPEVWKMSFHLSENPDRDELTKFKKAIDDSNATECGGWQINRPVPLKYQTQAYKNNMENIVKSLERIASEPESDCRFPGTFGRAMGDLSNDGYDYKFFNGKYFTKRKGDKEWVDVSNNQTIKDNIDKIAKSKGLVKDEKGLVYVK